MVLHHVVNHNCKIELKCVGKHGIVLFSLIFRRVCVDFNWTFVGERVSFIVLLVPNGIEKSLGLTIYGIHDIVYLTRLN